MEEKDADNIRKVLCKSFTVVVFRIKFVFVISTESTVLIRSAKAYSFVAVEVR